MVATGLVPSEVVILRPTRMQRVVGALTRAGCATPLLFGALLGDGMVPTALAATLIAGVVVFSLDLLVRADQAVELRIDCLVARGRTYPWWAIDRIAVRHHLGRDEVALGAFGMEPFALDSPRSSVVARHRRFPAEAALLVDAWERLRTKTPEGHADTDTDADTQPTPVRSSVDHRRSKA